MVEREREREREKSGVPVSAHVPCTWFCPHLQGELMVAGGRWLDIKKKKKEEERNTRMGEDGSRWWPFTN